MFRSFIPYENSNHYLHRCYREGYRAGKSGNESCRYAVGPGGGKVGHMGQ